MTRAELLAREAREWLSKANDDLESALVLAAAAHEANALYHCQQAGEKSLKAFLAFNDIPIRKTHDLKELGQSCVLVDASLTQLAAEADALTDYAWRLRYPGAPYIVGPAEVEEMITLAAKVLSQVQSHLPPDARLTQPSAKP